MEESDWYGLGLWIQEDTGLEFIRHSGLVFGFFSDLWFVPKDKLGMVVLTNAGSAQDFTSILGQTLIERLYDAEKKSEESLAYALRRDEELRKKVQERITTQPTDTEWIQQYVGTYYNEEQGTLKLKSSTGV